MNKYNITDYKSKNIKQFIINKAKELEIDKISIGTIDQYLSLKKKLMIVLNPR